MVDVTLRRVDGPLVDAVLRLRVAPAQAGLVASVQKSLDEVAGDPALTAYAAFDGAVRGVPHPAEPPVGFAVLEVRGGVGFVLRLLVDEALQGQGYGRALLVELVRRLRLEPDVEMVATSHRRENAAMAALCRSLGFEPWATPWPDDDPDEVFLRLPG